MLEIKSCNNDVKMIVNRVMSVLTLTFFDRWPITEKLPKFLISSKVLVLFANSTSIQQTSSVSFCPSRKKISSSSRYITAFILMLPELDIYATL